MNFWEAGLFLNTQAVQQSEETFFPRHLDWLDPIKALALLWIFVDHAAERTFGWPLIGNPDSHWPSLSVRIEQLRPLPITDGWDVIANVFRYVGWTGDQGVSIFLIASGLGLAWSQAVRESTGAATNRSDFWRRRLWRIYPIWIAAHLFILFPLALIEYRISPLDSELYFSLLGIRITPSQIAYGVPAWWFIGLILQLYLVFPLLYRWISRGRLGGSLVGVLLLPAIARTVGLFYCDDYLNAWNRGAVCIARLGEFSLGIWLALALRQKEQAFYQTISSPLGILLSVMAFAVGMAAALTLAGMAVANVMCGASVFCLSVAFFRSRIVSMIPGLLAMLNWFGRHSLSVYLVHQPIVNALLEKQAGAAAFPQIFVRLGIALLLTIAAALMLEFAASFLVHLVHYWHRQLGTKRLATRFVGVCVLALMLVGPMEWLVRTYDPQEVPSLGWGERPALIADELLGYRMRPSSTIRLRWDSYDYTVKTNSEGFPGPEFTFEKPAGTYRVMTLGDAFTSGEGVDTDRAWPRQLETLLNEATPDERAVEVINFGVTGYGPNQYAAIVETYAPRIAPDVIVIGFFTNDFSDVTITGEEFRNSIGFERPNPNCLAGWLTARHLFRYVRVQLLDRAIEFTTHRPSARVDFFSQWQILAAEEPEWLPECVRQVTERLHRIQEIAEAYGIPVVLASVPAPLQVADREDLHWLRPSVLQNIDSFDMDRPQRLVQQLANECGFEFLDLRPPLLEVTNQHPYFARNLHWTEVGHTVVARFIAQAIVKRWQREDAK